MSSCLSGGGRTYGFELELIKSPSSSNPTTIQSTTSSSSTLSESSNSPLSISTARKPRTPRKRPNQIYNEAAALLSTAYPYIFSRKNLTQNPGKFTKPRDSIYDESSESLLPYRLIDDFGIPLHHFQSIQDKPRFQFDQKLAAATNSNANFNDGSNFEENDDFDAESSILDEEIEEGIIDSIMGNLSVDTDYYSETSNSSSCHQDISINSSFGYPMPLGLGFGGNFELGFGFNWGLRKALKPVDDGDWWRFPAVDVTQISPRFNSSNNNSNVKVLNSAVKKKKKKIEKTAEENSNSELSEEKGIVEKTNSGLILKLNFDNVLNAWSDRGSPFSNEIQGSEFAGADLHDRLAQIDLCLENGVREASVMRYKEKRRTRLFSKKIRYQVRKVNADTRPRMKGRFVRRPSGS